MATSVLLTVLMVLVSASTVNGQSTAFTYQGQLTDSGAPASGTYDLQFKLFDAAVAGMQQGSTVTKDNVVVASGVFTTQLDFGAVFDGNARYLEIGVRPGVSTGTFQLLSPRQALTAAPYTSFSAAPWVTSGNNISYTPGNVAIGTASPATTSKLEIAAQDGVTINGFEPFLTLRDTNASGKRNILAAGNGDFGFYPNSFIGGAPAVIIEDFSGNVLMQGGKLGIGTLIPASSVHVVSPFADLHVQATDQDGDALVRYSTPLRRWATGVTRFTSGKFYISDQSPGGNIRLVIDESGNVGIGTLDPLRSLHVNGRARINSIPLAESSAAVCFNGAGDLLQCGLSSLRSKTNVKQFDAGLDVVRRLRPISFDWKDDGRADIGLGAEDVAAVAPAFTFTDRDGEAAGVKYERLNMLLINAIKEQQEQIERQQRELEQVRNANVNLNARLHALEKRLQ